MTWLGRRYLLSTSWRSQRYIHPTIVTTAAPSCFLSATSVIAINSSEASQHTTDPARNATPLIGQVGERNIARDSSAAVQLLPRVPASFGAFSSRHHAHRSAWSSVQDHQPRQQLPPESWPFACSNFFHAPTLKLWILQLLDDYLRYQVFTTRDLQKLSSFMNRGVDVVNDTKLDVLFVALTFSRWIDLLLGLLPLSGRRLAHRASPRPNAGR